MSANSVQPRFRFFCLLAPFFGAGATSVADPTLAMRCLDILSKNLPRITPHHTGIRATVFSSVCVLGVCILCVCILKVSICAAKRSRKGGSYGVSYYREINMPSRVDAETWLHGSVASGGTAAPSQSLRTSASKASRETSGWLQIQR